MASYKYPVFKILIDPDSKKIQGLRTGDVVRRQYYDNTNQIYSLMIVTDTGIENIGDKESHYFAGALVAGDEPRNGEILDFVRIANLFDPDRSGALYLTSSDQQAPYLDVIDGIAFKDSLCYPCMKGGNPNIPDLKKYACIGEAYLDTHYTKNGQGVRRIFRVTRNSHQNQNEVIGIKQPLSGVVKNPQRVIISYKIRASQSGNNIPVELGYSNGEEVDGRDTIEVTTDWSYKLHLISIDYPAQYPRCFLVNLKDFLVNPDDWVEIAELNIVCQSDISVFSSNPQTRIGKIRGVIDPIFGILEGYGAYFQNLYATKNVNIAGTLTAGDENGFSSTFYVGKIHKNVIKNSIHCDFKNNSAIEVQEKSPSGIGFSWKLASHSAIAVQSAEWRESHSDLKYCFSFWAKSTNNTDLSIYQGDIHIQAIQIDSVDWKRYYCSFFIQRSNESELIIRFESTSENLFFSAPQLEAGATPSQYQPTDGMLSYVEDYGAWFSKGGVGGTIQNPLLKLNDDGSISSRDHSFIIHPDGTGQFASGRFKWTKDTIVLQDITLRWEDFDDEAKQSLKPKFVQLSGTDTFRITDDELDDSVCEPENITVSAFEHNFVSNSRKWQYKASDASWKDLPGCNSNSVQITPFAPYWEERNSLSLKYIAQFNDKEYSEIFTISKLFDGKTTYSVQVLSSEGLVFRNGVISTTLTAFVYKGGLDITERIPESNFKWNRTSDNPDSDAVWNMVSHKGKLLEINTEDVLSKAVFDCEVILSLE